MSKLIAMVLIVLLMAIIGCETSNQSEKVMLEEMQKMQQRIDELESEIDRVEKKQGTNINVNESSTKYNQPTLSTCSNCNGLGQFRCDYCRGTGNSKSVCNICDGSGLNGNLACFRCGGSGFGICPFCLGEGRVLCNGCEGRGVR